MEFGLFAGGAVSSSVIARLPGLARRLGPVAAGSFRVASRMVNSLRAGQAVRDCGGLRPCGLILVSVPDEALAEAVGLLVASPVEWAGKSVLLCESGGTSHSLHALGRRGAAVGSFIPVEGGTGRFLIEGDVAAVRHARRLVRDLGGKAVEFDSSRMALYDAGRTLATSLFTPLIAAAVECLSEAGRDPATAAHVAEALLQKTLRLYLHSGKKSWSGPLAVGDRTAVERELEVLCQSKPLLARYYREAAAFALDYFNRHPDLRRGIAGEKG